MTTSNHCHLYRGKHNEICFSLLLIAVLLLTMASYYGAFDSVSSVAKISSLYWRALNNYNYTFFKQNNNNNNETNNNDASCSCNNKNTSNSSLIHVGVLVMATGKYAPYAFRLVESGRRFLLADNWAQLFKVTYFIFTDDQRYFNGTAPPNDVVIIYQKRLTWPSDTLLRCEVYLNASSHFITNSTRNMDFLFSLDADMAIRYPIGPEILGDLVGTQHPGFFTSFRKDFTYETRQQSCAYIPPDRGWHYFAGGVFGGRTANVIEMCQEITRCIKQDLNSSLVAVWHDESHLNRYFALVKHPTLILSPSYCYIEGSGMTFDQRIVALSKNHAEIRQRRRRRRRRREVITTDESQSSSSTSSNLRFQVSSAQRLVSYLVCLVYYFWVISLKLIV